MAQWHADFMDFADLNGVLISWRLSWEIYSGRSTMGDLARGISRLSSESVWVCAQKVFLRAVFEEDLTTKCM